MSDEKHEREIALNYIRGIPDEEIPGRFFNDTESGMAAIRAYLGAIGNPLLLEDIGAANFRAAGGIGPDGTVDLDILTAWEERYRGPLSLLPGLKRKLADARRAKEALQKVISDRKAARDEFEKSPAMLFVNYDPMTATEKLFALPDTTAAIQALIERIVSSENAINGLRKSIINYIIEKIGVTKDRSAAYIDFMRNNKHALSLIFDEDQMKQFRYIGRDIMRS